MSRELLLRITRKDFRVDTFRSGGPGGQYQNRTDSGVRVTHLESGAVGESRSERSQWQNKKLALEHLSHSPRFKAWLTRKVYEVTQKTTIEQEVDAMMRPENITVEYNDGNHWYPVEQETSHDD